MPENIAQSALSIASNQETGACWSCGSMRAAHYCQSCGKVQPAKPVDYFSFFGLPRKLNLDVTALERDFYALSRKLHPDLYAQSNEAEQRQWSLEKSSQRSGQGGYLARAGRRAARCAGWWLFGSELQRAI